MKNGWQTWAAIIAIIMGVGSAVAAHFNGIASARDYTDEKIIRIDNKLDHIQDYLSQQQADISSIKVMLSHK